MIFPYHNKIQALIRLSLWKPISNCIPGKEKKSRKKDGSTSLNSEKKFLKATALAFWDQTFESEVTIPDFNESFNKFITLYPNYQSSDMIDQLRADEYQHLSGSAPKVCLDYCGFGLFSYVQCVNYWESCTFNLSEISANLSNHAFYGCSGEGTVEHDIKTKIMDYLNIPENEYGIVFTVSRGSAFKLLAESYPFGQNRNLLTMFDHESQSVNWMAQCAKEKGAKVERAWFRWPTLRICSTDLRKQLSGKKKWKKGTAAGLFVFPVQSRVSGAKYSYQWMALAQKNNWHVCLDAGSLGPKDMDSLGLSLFRPDFIITSFYRVFGHDPTGFGCLLIKKSVASSLQNHSGYEGPGMVKIRPVFPQYLTDSIDGLQKLTEKHDDEVDGNDDTTSESRPGSHMPVFSGAFTTAQVKDVFETDLDDGNGSYRDGASTPCEDTESVLIEDVMKSPVFSEDESPDSSFWIDLGRSPILQPDTAPKQEPSSPSPPFWFRGRKSTKGTSPKPVSKTSSSLIDDKEAILGPHDGCNMASYDAAVQSVIEELDCITEATWNTRKGSHHQLVEPESREPHPCDDVNGFKPNTAASVFKRPNFGDSSISKSVPENDIRRETEFDLWLLGRSRGKKHGDGRTFGLEEDEQPESYMLDITDLSPRSMDEEDCASGEGEECDDRKNLDRREPEMICRHLDHVKMLGLNKTASRLRFLVNWFVSSLQQLKVPGDEDVEAVPLVIIYGPKIKYERGASVAFNVRDRNQGLISPEVVLKLAEIEGIYLGIGILSHIRILGNPKQRRGSLDLEDTKLCRQVENGSQDEENGGIWVEVVTASLGFLTNFEDVYKLWSFVAKFLNPSFTKTRGLPTVAEGIET